MSACGVVWLYRGRRVHGVSVSVAPARFISRLASAGDGSDMMVTTPTTQQDGLQETGRPPRPRNSTIGLIVPGSTAARLAVRDSTVTVFVPWPSSSVSNMPLTRVFVGPVGLEPTTRGLKVCHSRCCWRSSATNERLLRREIAQLPTTGDGLEPAMTAASVSNP